MSTLTGQYPRSIQPGRPLSLLVSAPALQRHAEPRAPRPSKGGAGPLDEEPLPMLEHLEPDPHFRTTFVMLLGGIIATIAIFLSLPYTQKISERALDRTIQINIDRSRPPPPPPPEIRPREEPKPEEIAKPELAKETPKLNLAQLEAAINPGTGGAGFADFSINFGALAAEDLSRVFELADLDRPPVPIYQQSPRYPYSLSREGIDGKVVLQFIVDSRGGVSHIQVVSSTRSEFERPAIEALEKWRFEPGMKSGARVSVRMEQPINFTITR